MKTSRAFSTAAAGALLLLASSASARAVKPVISGPGKPPEVCFAPNTDHALMDAYARALGQARAAYASSLAVPMAQLPDGNRWSRTAINGSGLGQGDPTTLTWHIVPDGTAISSGIGEPAAPSNLRAFLNEIYGSEAGWLPIFQQVFDRWSELTGITYVYEPADDASALFGASGVVGVRADIRIGGHPIDGNYNVLAYNYYPNNGDMVIDTGDAFFHTTTNDSLRLRNTVAHEHGHGLGFAHSCPINQTKLMEPMLSTSFDGPQLDEIYGGNRAYGDDLERNDTAATASDLGSISPGTLTLDDLSIDDESDSDYFLFNVGASKKVSVTATPIGATYLMGTQNSNGSCSAGTSFNSLVQNDLTLQVLDHNGNDVLASANATPAGQAESLGNVTLPTAGAYYVRVAAAGNVNAAQLYQLSLTVGDTVELSDDIFSDGFDAPGLDAWSLATTGGGDLAPSAAAAMAGARGLAATIDDAARLFVEDDTPKSESHYRARFSFDPNGFSPGDSPKKVQILQMFSRAPERIKLVVLFVRRQNVQYQLMAKVHTDDGATTTGWIPFSNAAHSIEIDWEKATSMGSNDGHFQLWLDGSVAATLPPLENSSAFLDSVRLGVIGAKASAGGTVYFDRFESHRTSYIGP